MDPREAEGRFAARLEEAGLPRFASAVHDAKVDLLELTWGHGVTLFMDLTRKDIEARSACSTPTRFAARARIEWCPSLAMLAEFCG